MSLPRIPNDRLEAALLAEVKYDELNYDGSNMIPSEVLAHSAVLRIRELESAIPLIVASASVRERQGIAESLLTGGDDG